MPTPPTIKDQCPDWATVVIKRICEIELRLGNIAPDGEWQTANLKDLFKEDDDVTRGSEATVVDGLFKQVCAGLATAGFGPDTIAAMVNARVPTGTRLAYCDASEVSEALGDSD